MTPELDNLRRVLVEYREEILALPADDPLRRCCDRAVVQIMTNRLETA